MKTSQFLGFSLVAAALLAGCTPAPITGTGSSLSSVMTNPDITVTSPTANSTISSPLTVTGQAKGSWYFEATFPVKLLDSNGNQIASSPATASGDWMTTNFVPFNATLTYTTTSATGTLVLEKDNPSGEPQNDASIIIPVNF